MHCAKVGKARAACPSLDHSCTLPRISVSCDDGIVTHRAMNCLNPDLSFYSKTKLLSPFSLTIFKDLGRYSRFRFHLCGVCEIQLVRSTKCKVTCCGLYTFYSLFCTWFCEKACLLFNEPLSVPTLTGRMREEEMVGGRWLGLSYSTTVSTCFLNRLSQRDLRRQKTARVCAHEMTRMLPTSPHCDSCGDLFCDCAESICQLFLDDSEIPWT